MRAYRAFSQAGNPAACLVVLCSCFFSPALPGLFLLFSVEESRTMSLLKPTKMPVIVLASA